jgi:hypothetical protein
MDGARLLERITEVREREDPLLSARKLLRILAANLRVISDPSGEIIARAAIVPEDDFHYSFGYGSITVGGLQACGLGGIAGILKGVSTTAARDSAIPVVEGSLLSEWASSQAILLSGLPVEPHRLAQAAEIVRRCGGDTGPMPIVQSAQGWLSAKGVRELMPLPDEVILISELFLRGVEQDLGAVKLLPNVLACSSGRRAIVSTRAYGTPASEWPDPLRLNDQRFMDRSNEAEVVRLLAASWSSSVKEVLAVSDIYTDKKSFEREVANAGGKTLVRTVNVVRNPRAAFSAPSRAARSKGPRGRTGGKRSPRS